MSRKYPEGSYVYLHIRKSDGLVFYVGNGSGGRAWLKSGNQRSLHWKRVAKKHGVTVELYSIGMSEQCALTLEKIIIAKYRHLGHPLVNQTDGGEGISGFIPPRSIAVFSSFGEDFTSCTAAAKYLRSNGYPKASHAAIQKCCKGIKHTAYDRAWSYDNHPKHPERVGNRNRGQWQIKNESIAVETLCGMKFVSMQGAARFLKDNGWPKAIIQPISFCCKGKRKNAYGYKWRYSHG